MNNTIIKYNYLALLDGVRGLMALCVFVFHLELLCLGQSMRGMGLGARAVDVFMFLSGFLMAYHWHIREKSFKGFWAQVKDFYIRRFFRIAPLYYLLLTFSFTFQSYYFSVIRFLNETIPRHKAEAVAAVQSPLSSSIDINNIIMHYSFLFGLFPQFSNNNVLPDWSISLEMQFYFLFPFLMAAISRLGSLTTVLLCLLVSLFANKFIGLYTASGHGDLFYVLPSLILFKLNIFVSGICVAIAYFFSNERQSISWLLLGFLALANVKVSVIGIVLFILFLLFFDEQKREWLNRCLSGRLSKFLGDTSYAVYLVHYFILLPILSFLFHQENYVALNPYFRLIIAFALTVIPVYSIAYLLYRFVEIPGIQLGRNILKRNFSTG